MVNEEAKLSRISLNSVRIENMHLAVSGYVYMLVKCGNVWSVRWVDGVEKGKIPYILANRFETGGDGVVSRDVAYARLMKFGVCKDDLGCWEIAGIDMDNDILYLNSKLVHSSSKRKEVKGLFDFITNMAKMSKRFGSGELRMHFLGDGERDEDNKPHLHFKVGQQSLASIAVDSSDIIKGELPRNYRKDILRCIEENRLYYKFCWDFLTKQKMFTNEYAGREPEFTERLRRDNPNIR